MATATWSDAGPVSATDEAVSVAEPRAILQRIVLERLRREGYRFSFDQAVRLLEMVFPEAPVPGETAHLRAERVRIVPDPALIFPPADIRRIVMQERPEQPVRLQVTFMGLYGVGAPGPDFIRDAVAIDTDDVLALRDFLDIFNHRLYTFFYRAWKKYRPELYRPGEGAKGTDLHTARFLALSGLATPGAGERLPVSRALLIAFAGRLMPRARSAEGLQALMGSWLQLPVLVVENVPRWVEIWQRPRIGRGGMQLGVSAIVGRRVYDLMGKFRLCIGPMDRSAYLSLLPGGDRAAALAWLIRMYVPGSLDFDLELRLRAHTLPPTRLGDRDGRLGLTTGLGKPRTPILSRVVQYAKAVA